VKPAIACKLFGLKDGELTDETVRPIQSGRGTIDDRRLSQINVWGNAVITESTVRI
jgi:hypothetical protein